jgi:drug/metabolite transporter (DMT)-like permease
VTPAMLFAVLAGVSTATWTICLKLGSTKINAALGAMVITSIAFVVNSIAMLAMRAKGHEIVFKPEGLWLLVVAGIAASGVDIFGLLAYERGLKVTSSLVIGGTATALVLVVGFAVLREPLTWTRLLAILLIAAGMLLLQSQGG